jgi:DNA-binding NtrC family response regulator
MAEDSRQILVVEDHAPLGYFIKWALDGAGWAVVGPIAAHRAAMDAARRLPLALVVIDRMLQEKETFAIAEAAIERGIPCLLMSGHPHSTMPERFQDLPFLEKPFTMKALFDAVQAALSGG